MSSLILLLLDRGRIRKLLVERDVGGMPDIGEADGGVEVVEEEEGQGHVDDQEPGEGVVVRELDVLVKYQLLRLNRDNRNKNKNINELKVRFCVKRRPRGRQIYTLI